MELDPDSAVSTECKVYEVSVKLWSAIETEEERQKDEPVFCRDIKTCEEPVFTTDVTNKDDTGRQIMTGHVDDHGGRPEQGLLATTQVYDQR